jgi:hypothetical protein
MAFVTKQCEVDRLIKVMMRNKQLHAAKELGAAPR